jgi:hypothetical protein
MAGKNRFYAFRCAASEGRVVHLSMHEEVLNFKSSRHQVIDHINGDPLDNRKENLRICTARQNACNRRPLSTKTGSKYKCIYYVNRPLPKQGYFRKCKSWRVHIIRNRKLRFNQYFADEYDAWLKSQEMLKEHHGEFAYLVPWTGYSNPQYPNKPINYKPESDH